MEKIKDYVFLHLAVILFSFTSVFSKSASIQLRSGGLKNPLLYVFAFLMFFDCFIYAICWQKIIKKFDLRTAVSTCSGVRCGRYRFSESSCRCAMSSV